MTREFFDSEGNSVSLDAMCRREPAWAASRIRAMMGETSTLRAEERESCRRIVNAERQTAEVSAGRARADGRETVALRRESESEALQRVLYRIDDMAEKDTTP